MSTSEGSTTYEDYEIQESDVEPIPTLSEWGLILLMMALLGIGIYYLNRRDNQSLPL